jgi:hypothetical protein
MDNIQKVKNCINIELLGFRTLSIVRILIITRKKNKHDVSETGSVSALRWGKTPILLGPLERANLNQSSLTWGRKQIQFPKRRVCSFFL